MGKVMCYAILVTLAVVQRSYAGVQVSCPKQKDGYELLLNLHHIFDYRNLEVLEALIFKQHTLLFPTQSFQRPWFQTVIPLKSDPILKKTRLLEK